MADSLPARLRIIAKYGYPPCDEAAAEIERLTAELQRERQDAERCRKALQQILDNVDGVWDLDYIEQVAESTLGCSASE